MNEDKNIKIARLIGLEKKVREALSKDELNFILVNEIREIIDFTNAFLLKQTPIGTFNVEAISDLAIIDRTAPLVNFIEKIVNHKDHNQPKDIINIDIQDFAKKNKLTKNKNLPNILILIPIHSPQKGHQGFVAINRESEINDSEIELLKHLSGTFGHAFNSFISTFPIKESINKYFPKSKKIPLDKFISNVLYDKNYGYYSKKIPFGKRGDFVTAPEISFLYSEILALWIVSLWEHLNKPKTFNVVELGPGSGQMNSTLIKVFKKFPNFFKSTNIFFLPVLLFG